MSERGRPDRAPGREPLLAVRDLRVDFQTRRGMVTAVDGVSLDVGPGERVAIVGESGSGKSISALSIMGLLPSPGRIAGGSIRYDGTELTGLGERELSRIRGSEIGLVLQQPQAALDPLRTAGQAIEQSLRLHQRIPRADARRRALELIDRVGIGDPEARARQRPHELSGGMCQRVTVAAALGPGPRLLIADEPTSALDATTAAGVLDLISNLSRDEGLAVLLITHDLGVVARFADRVVVMYAGRVVEEGPVEAIFGAPRNPYTRALLASTPGEQRRRQPPAMRGALPEPGMDRSGCVFRPRCSLTAGRPRCADEVPALRAAGTGPGHRSACHFLEELSGVLEGAPASAPEALAVPPAAGDRRAEGGPDDLLVLDGVSKSFRARGRLFGESRRLCAVDDVSFAVGRDEVLALVGESGSGKSTTARMVLGLETPDAGRVVFDGTDVFGDPKGRQVLHRRVQAVFQNPDGSLDPRMKVEDIIAEPLVVHRVGDRASRLERVRELLELVGLNAGHVGRYPFEFSGGQRQRIAIARALALQPALVVCDEPVTALDVSVQAQILDLLQDLRRDHGLSYLFIAHDLGVVREIADRVAVMYLGSLVEVSDADRFFEQPQHPYSAALLSAVAVADPAAERERERIVLSGSIPSPLDAPPACRFHTRCWKAQAACREIAPPLREVAPGRWAACHFPEHAPAAVAEGPVHTSAARG